MGDLIPVILAGGKGERFWPLSRQNHPKQFMKILPGGKSLIQATAERLLPLSRSWNRLYISTSHHLAGKILEELPELPPENLILEPEPKDTAAAVAWATLQVAERHGKGAVMGVFPADHHITPPEAFKHTIEAAASFATQHNAIITFGIQPTHPATGYGYIEQGERASKQAGLSVYRVARFTEKPDSKTAEHYFKSGKYFWNSGIFVFQIRTMLEELMTHALDIFMPLKERGLAAFPELPKTSIDYAVMEKTNRARVVPAPFIWDDLGDWTALERILGATGANIEFAKHIGLDTNGAIIYATSKDEVILTLGLEDVIIVRDGNVTLVAKKNRIQEIKALLRRLKEEKSLESLV